MAIQIEGVRLNSLAVTRESEGQIKLSGQYAIMASNGVALAKQSFGGSYDDLKIAYSGETMQALNNLIEQVKKDVNVMIGMG